MKQISYRLRSLAMLTVTVIATVNPMTPRGASATTVADLNQDVKAVEISVPPPDGSPREAQSIDIFVPRPERANDGICPNFLGATIDSIIERPSFARGKWGILVESLSEETILYRHNADEYLIPASNIKLLTTAAALQKLDPKIPIRSTSLAEWVKVTNLNSNNSYADTLLRTLGGSQVVKDTLAQLGVDPKSYQQVDGSGLSRQNLATPTALVAILKAMDSANARDVFYPSLPVAGVSGTLRNRLHYPTVQGKVHAKTGTLKGVRALSGYLEHPDYGTIVFSIIVNQPSQSGQTLVGAVDEIVLRLTQLTPC